MEVRKSKLEIEIGRERLNAEMRSAVRVHRGAKEKNSPQSSQRGSRGHGEDGEKRRRCWALDRKSPPLQTKGGHPQVHVSGAETVRPQMNELNYPLTKSALRVCEGVC